MFVQLSLCFLLLLVLSKINCAQLLYQEKHNKTLSQYTCRIYMKPINALQLKHTLSSMNIYGQVIHISN